jgi:hypothetical protein
MRATATFAVISLAGMLSFGCGEPDAPTLVGLVVWEGYLANPGKPVLQRPVDPGPDGGFTLRQDTLHLARVQVRTSGRADRCLFRPFSYSWAPPSREYECYPEIQDGPMTIDVPFATWRTYLGRVSDYYLLVQLYEHGPGQKLISVYDTRRYPVRFTD